MGCYEIECGDGYLDSGENRNTCCRDAGCYGGKKCHEGKNKCVDCVSDGDCRNQVCDPKSNICVRCYNDGHCGSGKCNTVTHQCVECIKDEDCESKTIWDNQFFCSPDHNSVMEKGRIVSGKCDVRTQTCKGEETPTTRTAKNCRTQQTYCQDKVCGCAEDYAPCTAEGMCVKKAVLNENDPCGCDFQCTSGYCAPAGKTCFKAVSAEFSETRTKLTVGEESEVTLSVNNHLDKDVFAKILINKGSGASISSEVEGADICAGNQCTASSKIPAKSSNRITLKLQGQDNVVVPITAEVTYQVYAGSKKAQKLYTATALEKEITYVICGDGQCNSDVGEDKTNCCGDCAYPQSTFFREYSCPNPKEGYVSKAKVRNYIYSFLAFIILALIVLGLIYSRKLRSIRRTRMDKIKVEKEKENATKRRERNKIRKAFKLIDDKIDHKKPPTARTVKKWLKKGFNMEFNDKLFNEEYVILVGELEEEAKQKETEEKIKQKEAEQKNKRKFCRKCGGTLKKPGAKFCTKCGAKQ